MKLYDRLHNIHRFWRFRLRDDRESVMYLLRYAHSEGAMLDIGANKGVYSYWMSKKVKREGKVIAFEPQPELNDYITDLKAAFGLQNVQIVNKALSSSEGEMNLYRRMVGDGSAMLEHESNKLYNPSNKEAIKVQVTTLDKYVEENKVGPISFIKCDVEGHEIEVFKGGENTLKKYMPALLFECHHEEAKDGTIFNYLVSLGYDGFYFDKSEKIHYTDFAKVKYPRSDNHRNYVFIKKK